MANLVRYNNYGTSMLTLRLVLIYRMFAGNKPSTEPVEGPYPTLITRTGSTALVAHAHGFGKYLGVLQVSFDAQGHLVANRGNPVVLDHSIEKGTTKVHVS